MLCNKRCAVILHERSHLMPINSLERLSVILELTASAAFGIQKPKQNIMLSNFIFYYLSGDI